MSFDVVVAADLDWGIGKANGLPWPKLKADMAHFRRVTSAAADGKLNAIIMGRKTWESLGKALPGRENIVVTRNAGYEAPGAAVATSLEAALALCAGEKVAFVIGGQQLFADSLPIASGIVLTEILKDYEGDTWFPEFDRSRWHEAQREPHTAADCTRFDLVLYQRVP